MQWLNGMPGSQSPEVFEIIQLFNHSKVIWLVNEDTFKRLELFCGLYKVTSSQITLPKEQNGKTAEEVQPKVHTPGITESPLCQK